MSKDCKHYDAELDCCKLLSDWSEAMPVLQPCIDGPCTEYEMAADDKQIEEIVKILFAHISVNSTDDDVWRCANHLYRVGYRRQSEGEWVFEFNLGGDDFYKCSVCGRQEVINGLCRERSPVEHLPYCHCGAKMKGE